MASPSSGSKRGVEDAGDVYDFGAGFDEDTKASGARFLSVEDDGWRPDGTSVSLLDRLSQKAAAAVEARRPKVKKLEIKARFGGARAALADNQAAGTEQTVFDAIEAEFLRELEDNVPQTFLSPEDADDDHEDEENRIAPFFYTEDVWEDIDFNQRKKHVVEELQNASERVANAQRTLPGLKVENDRLKKNCHDLEREAINLENQEKKIFQRYPDFKKRYQQQVEEKEEDLAAKQAEQEALDAEEKRERMRQEEKLRRRMMKRRAIILQGLGEVEENERDKGEIFVSASHNTIYALYMAAMAARLSVASWLSAVDPYRYSMAIVLMKIPRAAPYFRMLRRVLMFNIIFILVSVPQILAWIAGKDGEEYHGFCSDDSLIMPCAVRYSSMPQFPFQKQGDSGPDMSLLYICFFAAAYVVFYLLTMNALFRDVYTDMRAEIFQDESDPFKFSRIVFNTWNCSVFSSGAHKTIIRTANAALALLLARHREEGVVGSADTNENDDRTSPPDDEENLFLVRSVGLVVVMGVTVGTWILLEVLGPRSLSYYPNAWQRLMAPIISACFNQWIAPTIVRYWITSARVPKTLHAKIVLIMMFFARLVNVIIVMRRQFLLFTASDRVALQDSPRDTCFCEDEVGANMLYFWTCDWAASLIKVVGVPLFHRIYHRLNRTHRVRMGGRWVSAWQPSFEISVWLIDIAFGQLLFLFTVPLFPSAGILSFGMGLVTFAVQRMAVVNLWEPPKNVVYSPRHVRLFFSICQVVSLHVATLVYYFFWTYGSTDSWTAPVCKLPLLYQNATTGALCSFDPFTGTTVSPTSCSTYITDACRRMSTSSTPFLTLYPLLTPSAITGERLHDVRRVVAAPVLAWLCTALLVVRYLVQRHYRQRFYDYVQEQRFRLLIKLSTLERNLKKQEKILEIQSQY